VLGVSDVEVLPADTDIDSAGSTSASRQTMTSGSAVRLACVAVRERLLRHVAGLRGVPADALVLRDGVISGADGPPVPIGAAAPGRTFRATERFTHRPTGTFGAAEPMYVAFGFSAQRAVVDVDAELGLVRVVQVASCQDVGRVVNPVALRGQIEGGIVQGLGLALMEELVIDGGRITNPDLQDYLIPTIVDAPEVLSEYVQQPQPHVPYGWKGVGEPPLCTALPAIAAAVRAATGLALTRVPIRPEHIALRRATPPVVTWATGSTEPDRAG
jgi:CO/xanthine dehydrogenase Mo-binding subunit